MQSPLKEVEHEYLVDESGHKRAVVLKLEEYESMVEMIEDLEDANDLLRAESEAASFTPYEEFREEWLKG